LRRILRTLPENQVEAKALAEKFMPFRKRKIEKIGQNLKYDLKILSNYGINVEGNYLTP
jgi:DNA polymerase-1